MSAAQDDCGCYSYDQKSISSQFYVACENDDTRNAFMHGNPVSVCETAAPVVHPRGRIVTEAKKFSSNQKLQVREPSFTQEGTG